MTALALTLLLLASGEAAPLERARAYAADWLKQLPDFLCDQSTKRLKGSARDNAWFLLDTIDTEVSFVAGKERYRLLRIDGRPVDRERTVTTRTLGSSGEFASALRWLFAPEAQAEFRDSGTEKIGKLRLRRFHYAVKHENSRWAIGIGTRYMPGYQGSVWVEEETGRIRRLTMETKEFPKDFPVRSSSFRLDYMETTIGDRSYLMPAQSRVEACDQNGICDRKEIEFTNYRKFTAQSQIVP